MGLLRRLVLTAAACATLPAMAAAEPMHILYDLDPHVEDIVSPIDGARGLDHTRGAFRQEGSSGHLFAGEDDAGNRLGKVNSRDLEGLSAAGIARALRRQIDHGCVIAGRDYGCESHLVTVDEIGRAFSDRDGSLGRRLAQAMLMLEKPSPWGGTYASRVHFFVAPVVTSQFAAARGRNHNLGRDGRPHFPTWSAAMTAFAHGGGVWLEMYHAKGGVRRPFSVGEWQRGPRDFRQLYMRAGGKPDRIHFLVTGTPRRPPGRLRGCSTPMSCTWKLAGARGANASILRNGVGAYRVGDQAAQWLAEHNARFTG